MHTQHPARFALLFLALLWVPSVFAQTGPQPITYAVSAMSYGETEREINQIAKRFFKDALGEKVDWAEAEHPFWHFLLRVEAVAHRPDEVGVSLVTLKTVPEHLVALGKREEAFYLALSDSARTALPAEGQWIRQQMSEDFMRQFNDVQGLDLVVVAKTDLADGMRRLVDRFVHRHFAHEE